MKNQLIIISLLILYSCDSGHKNKLPDVDSSGHQSKFNDSLKTTTESIRKLTPDFLKLSKKSDSYFGILQGVKKSDSAGNYYLREYISDTLSFNLIFYPLEQVKDSVKSGDIERGAMNNYKAFACFAFVYPMLDPYKMKDYHDDNVKYPVNVKSYIKRDSTWHFISEMKINSLVELSKYEIKTMYDNEVSH